MAPALSLVLLTRSADNPLMRGIGERTFRTVLEQRSTGWRRAGQGLTQPRLHLRRLPPPFRRVTPARSPNRVGQDFGRPVQATSEIGTGA